MREAELEKKLVERVKELGGEGMSIFQRLYGRQRVWVRTDAVEQTEQKKDKKNKKAI